MHDSYGTTPRGFVSPCTSCVSRAGDSRVKVTDTRWARPVGDMQHADASSNDGTESERTRPRFRTERELVLVTLSQKKLCPNCAWDDRAGGRPPRELGHVLLEKKRTLPSQGAINHLLHTKFSQCRKEG